MQIIVFVSIVLVSTYVGVILAKKYIRKENFYIDLLAFCNTTFTEINFTQNKLKKIIEQNINYYKKDFKLFLSLYKKCLDGEVSKKNFGEVVHNNFEFLTEQEINKIVSFFINIGKRLEKIDAVIAIECSVFKVFKAGIVICFRMHEEVVRSKFHEVH